MYNDFKQLNNDYFTGKWFESEKDIDVLLSKQNNLQRLRMLSTYMVRNNFLSHGTREAIVSHVCGDRVTVKPVYRKKIHKRILDRLTIDLAQADVSRSISLPEIIRQQAGMSFEKGDTLINICSTGKPENGTMTYVEVIDGSRIKTPPKFRRDSSVIEGIHKVGGIMLGAWVRKLQDTIGISYAVASESDANFVYVPFFSDIEVDGVMMHRRVALLVKGGNFSTSEQTRGVPATVASAGLNRYHEDSLNVELVGKRLRNAIVGFITTTDKKGTADNLADMSDDNNQLESRGMLNPGTLASLKPGEAITLLNPSSHTDGDDLNTKRILRLSALPNQIPYEILHQDLSGVNYSSLKAGQTQMNRSLTGWDIQAMKVAKLVVDSFLFEYYMTGYVNVKPDDLSVFIDIPRPVILDNEKDARGEKIELSNGSSSIHDLHERRGTDYDSTQAERQDEALQSVQMEAEILVERKRLSELYGITFPEDQSVGKSPSKTTIRPGEQVDPTTKQPSDEDKRNRRIEDGNY